MKDRKLLCPLQPGEGTTVRPTRTGGRGVITSGTRNEFIDEQSDLRVLYFDFDYASQLQAARDLLTHNVQADVALADDIRDAEGWVSQSSGDENDFAVDHTVELIFRSIYQRVGAQYGGSWRDHSIHRSGLQRCYPTGWRGITSGRFCEESTEDHQPCWKWTATCLIKLAITTNALFRYRNELFHWGFEWPPHVRRNFEEAMNSWSSDWFEVANLNVQFPRFHHVANVYRTLLADGP